MTTNIPGAIINVRRGQYEDASGFLHTGWLHDHVCLFPACGGLVECEGQPSDEESYDGSLHCCYACEQSDIDPLCHMHADAKPCGYCGEYGHVTELCPEMGDPEDDCDLCRDWTGEDWREHAADAANQDEKDGQ